MLEERLAEFRRAMPQRRSRWWTTATVSAQESGSVRVVGKRPRHGDAQLLLDFAAAMAVSDEYEPNELGPRRDLLDHGGYMGKFIGAGASQHYERVCSLNQGQSQ
jgi:hypothetical protein